jgi:NADH-quinone oxidoreductase subunit H
MATFAKQVFYLIPGPVWLALKTLIFLFLFVFVRAALPRYRYDRLMVVKVLLPISLAWFYLHWPRCIVLNYFNFN